MMDDLKAWIELISDAGGTVILAIGCWQLWLANREERNYSRERDEKTLSVLNALTTALQNRDAHSGHQDDKVLNAIQHCEETIIGHIDKTALSGTWQHGNPHQA